MSEQAELQTAIEELTKAVQAIAASIGEKADKSELPFAVNDFTALSAYKGEYANGRSYIKDDIVSVGDVWYQALNETDVEPPSADWKTYPATAGQKKLAAVMSADDAALVRTISESAVTVEKLNNPDETAESILGRLNKAASENRHIVFDTSAIDVAQRMFLCTVSIDEDNWILKVRDAITMRQYIGMYLPDETIEEILSKSVDLYVPITVEARTQDGVVVRNQTVSLYEGTDDTTGVLRQTEAYNGQPVTFTVAKGFNYFVKITSTLQGHFAPSTAYGTAQSATSVVLVYQDVSHIEGFLGLQAAVRSLETVEDGQALVGIEIPDTFTSDNGTTKYDNPMRCVAVKKYVGEDGLEHIGAKMERVWCAKSDLQFDAANREVATETTAQPGIHYYGHAPIYSNQETYAKDRIVRYDGKFYQCTTAVTAAEEFDSSKWTEKTATTYTAAGFVILNVAEGQPLPTQTQTGEGVMDGDYAKIFKNAYLDTSKNILMYGHNRWETSAWRQYLNSDGPLGNWWVQQHVGQVAPSQHGSLRGYLAGCSPELLAVAKKVKVSCYSNNICDGGGVYETLDLFWLSSGTEVYGVVNDFEGNVDKYWKDAMPDVEGGWKGPNNAANAARIHYRESNHSSAANCWLRSATRGTSCIEWVVYTTGQVYSYYASTSGSGVPACVIY